jgi:hypothetical protein
VRAVAPRLEREHEKVKTTAPSLVAVIGDVAPAKCRCPRELIPVDVESDL